jgi:MYXO-CTERM domain-containing protein
LAPQQSAFERTRDSFVARSPVGGDRLAEVVLPSSTDRPFLVRDRASGASMAVTISDRRTSRAQGRLSRGRVEYVGRAATVSHSARPDGTEDRVVLAAGDPVVRYRVELGDDVAALRRVGNVVEFLDTTGAPRLRVSAPWVADARGARHPVELVVENCRYDSDPRPPWGRPVTPPGSRVCSLRLSWDGARVGFPATLDPIWSLTGFMARTRSTFCLVPLTSGKVLAAGGTNYVDTELYDPASGTWALTGPLASAYSACAGARLTSGKVLAVSGSASATYDPTSGQWTTAGSLNVTRYAFGLALLSNGKVLVAGGATSTSPYSTQTSELFDPAAGSWSPSGDMTQIRRDLTLTTLPQGRVLAVSGSTAETYDETAGTWSAAAPPPTPHSVHTAVLLQSGKVLLIGGNGSNKSDLFDPATSTWTAGPDLAFQRWKASSVLLTNGHVVVTGGWDDTLGGEVEDSERYVPALDQWILNGPLQYLRYAHASAPLPNGDAIVAGGMSVIIDYIDSVERLSLSIDGVACQSSNECRSAYCVGGIWCDQPCDGVCQTCRASEKASGGDGVCGFAKAGVDPADDCPDQGATSCGTNGVCDGAGACAKYPSGTACAAPVCQGGTLHSSACSAQGVCVQASTSCAPYACADGVSCATTCALDTQCQSAATCDVASGACIAPQANGASCAGDAQCTSGYCVDGVCCDSACTDPCKACSVQKKGGGSDGQCGNVAAGTDPDGDCPTDSPASCQRDGTCSGAGTCRLYANGTICGLTACVGNAQVGAACDGAGSCNGSSCNTSCTASSDCAPDAWCDAGTCQPRLASGTACVAGDQCESGFCVDGVCCQTPCAGQCAACDTPGALGLCVPIKGTPHGTRPACPGGSAGVCSAKACDGVERDSCNGFVAAEVECRSGTCNQGVATLAAQCDGFGACPAEQSTPCAPYACDAGACKSTCQSDKDCAAGASCSPTTDECVAGAVCTGPSTSRNAQGSVVECKPYACSGGTCRTSCGSIQDCAPGFVCSGSGKCVAPASGSGDSGGCAVAASSSSRPRLPGAALLALALAFFGRRRRDARERH